METTKLVHELGVDEGIVLFAVAEVDHGEILSILTDWTSNWGSAEDDAKDLSCFGTWDRESATSELRIVEAHFPAPDEVDVQDESY